MNSDAYFEIGTTHVACQDYALAGSFTSHTAGVNKNMSYGIVSDGCSSAEHSEIGAQILCHVAQYYLTLYHDLFLSIDQDSLTTLLGNSILKRADEIRKLYPISNASLQATLLIGVMFPEKAFVFAWGDGVIILPRSGYTEVVEIEYPETNAPFYLATGLDEYQKKFGSSRRVRVLTKTLGQKEFEVREVGVETPFSRILEVEDPRIILCTDGINQYLDEKLKPIPNSKIIPEIIDYPSTKGVFVQRTMNFLKKDFLRRGWSHADDMGVAGIVV